MSIIRNEPADIYHNNVAIGSHKLMDFDSAAGGHPKFFQKRYIEKSLEGMNTKAFLLGRVVHALALEDKNDLTDSVTIIPQNLLAKNGAKSTDEAKNFVKERELKGEVVLTQKEHDEIIFDAKVLADAVRLDPEFKKFTMNGEPELTFRHKHKTGIDVQCRYDWINMDHPMGPRFFDLKTCDTLEDFFYGQRNYHYNRQASWYRDIGFTEVGEKMSSLLCVVEKKGTNRVQWFGYTNQEIQKGSELNQLAMHRLADCIERNYWPDDTGGIIMLGSGVPRNTRVDFSIFSGKYHEMESELSKIKVEDLPSF